jgi:hypothetical protein
MTSGRNLSVSTSLAVLGLGAVFAVPGVRATVITIAMTDALDELGRAESPFGTARIVRMIDLYHRDLREQAGPPDSLFVTMFPDRVDGRTRTVNGGRVGRMTVPCAAATPWTYANPFPSR